MSRKEYLSDYFNKINDNSYSMTRVNLYANTDIKGKLFEMLENETYKFKLKQKNNFAMITDRNNKVINVLRQDRYRYFSNKNLLSIFKFKNSATLKNYYVEWFNGEEIVNFAYDYVYGDFIEFEESDYF